MLGRQRQQRVHRQSGTLAQHRQRLLADGRRVRGPGHRHGLQRTGQSAGILLLLVLSN